MWHTWFMSFQYTPAAERALHAAACWMDSAAGSEITPLALLLGLAEQTECRAAKLLERVGIDMEVLQARQPTLRRRERANSDLGRVFLSHEAENGLHAALLRLDENPRTCQLATEHMLLGLSLGDDPPAVWLREQGIDPAAMEAEICARYGIDHSPIPIDFDEPAIPLSEVPPPAATPPAAGRVGLLRILDAAANRAGEAVRVVEDHARFVLNDAALMRECKEMRHALAAALSVLPQAERLAARDTTGDVGTEISTPSEGRRTDVDDVASANLRRLQESLRSLEEYGKVFDPALGQACEQLRYRSYTLQKQFAERSGRVAGEATDLATLDDRRSRLAAAKLYVLVDGRASSDAFGALVEQLIAAGVEILQLRDKTLDDRTLLARARRLRAATAGTKTLFIMNDRPDLALLADADGVHVGQEELSVAEARAIVGCGRLIGVSTHSLEQARQAVADGADYLGVGPTFPSGTKQFTEFPGLAFVSAVAGEISLPAFAIGGIDVRNVAEIRTAGSHRVAVSGAVLNAANPCEAVEKLRAALV